MNPENNPAETDPKPEAAPATPTAPPATEPETPETEPAPEGEPETETPAAPAEASAAAPPARLSAFQRGALRALSLGELVSRVEAAESNAAALQTGNASLTAENQRLLAENSRLKAAIPLKVAEAAQMREDQVAKAVAAELQGLGIAAAAAPSQLTAETAEKIKTRAEFDAMKPKERADFLKNGGKLTD